jgi:hypothetical protein
MMKSWLRIMLKLLAVTPAAVVAPVLAKDPSPTMPHSYRPRPTIPSPTELAQLPADGGPQWNRLVFEKSPYLQQHAANPVDWFPWGAEAFDTARRLDKPVFLSVGYSTCHWCHVMEHESFEDDTIAAMMNAAFVCVKVDREERPDVDQVYMGVTQALTGSGGWPMTVLMTADKQPFLAGTYFPKEGRYGRPGMPDLVRHVGGLWRDDRAKLLEQAEYITREISRSAQFASGDAPTSATLQAAFEELEERYDASRGGFGSRPKFPTPHNYSFLLRYWQRTGSEDAARIVNKSLQAIRLGGVFDQVGLGLHRYSTDELWLVPHFEKMLYDQALYAIACTEAWQALGNDAHRQAALDVYEYVLRDLRSPEGGFYSAEDADSEGEEGRFYVWSVEEVFKHLGEEEGNFFAKSYGFTGEGNFYEESTGTRTGTNIPFLVRDAEGMAKLLNVPVDDWKRRTEASRRTLFAIREERVHPFKDDKILTDWNGLMIAALAKSARAFGDDRLLSAARDAADFALKHLRTSDGRLLKRYRHGEAGLTAHLEDYAFLGWGMVELYQATFDARYLQAALDCAEAIQRHFPDHKNGGFFLSPDDGEQLIVRMKEAYDGAIPSGNSVAALLFLKLSRLTGSEPYEQSAEGIFKAFAPILKRHASGFCQMMIALAMALGDSTEIILVGDPDSADFRALRDLVAEHFLPHAVVLHRPLAGDAEVLRLLPHLAAYQAIDGKATAYVCQRFACQAPTTEPKTLAKQLGAKAP